jgi:hypothetical protein
VVSTLYAQEITGRWQFNSITNIQGDTLIKVSEGDFMEIKSDGTFHYELEAKNNLIANGTWENSNNFLCYTYILPTDTTRCYTTGIHKNELILNEGSINFSFIKAP